MASLTFRRTIMYSALTITSLIILALIVVGLSIVGIIKGGWDDFVLAAILLIVIFIAFAGAPA